MTQLQLFRYILIFAILSFCVFSFTLIHQSWGSCTANDDHCHIYRPHVKLAFVTSYYHSDQKTRASELDVSLASLVANPIVNQVHVLIEPKDEPLPSFAAYNPKVIQHQFPHRPLVGDFLLFICDHQELHDHRIFFANSDIFFDTSLDYFTKISDKVFDSTFYAITRLEFDPSVGLTYAPLDSYGSSDTWVFKPRAICEDKIRLQMIVSNLNYTLGHLGGENRMLYEIRRQYPKLNWVNPCKSVRTIHIHDSKIRTDSW
ncbi:putative ATP-dependent RNA helicase ddx49, partial [Entomortierella chlamydospora]